MARRNAIIAWASVVFPQLLRLSQLLFLQLFKCIFRKAGFAQLLGQEGNHLRAVFLQAPRGEFKAARFQAKLNLCADFVKNRRDGLGVVFGGAAFQHFCGKLAQNWISRIKRRHGARDRDDVFHAGWAN